MNKLIFSLAALLLVLSQAPDLAIAEESETVKEAKPADDATTSAQEANGEAGKDSEKKSEEEPDC